MSFSIIVTTAFEKELRHLLKKFPSIKTDLTNLTKQLLQQPMFGIPIGHDCYKIRMAITSKGKGNQAEQGL